MKKTVTMAAALALFCMLCGFTPRLAEMFDEADLFTAKEEESLVSEAKELAEQTETEIVFLTYDDAKGKDAERYTDDFCDAREFGYGGGEEESFMMLAIDMDNREVYVKTGGSVIARVTDREIEYILDEIFVWMPEGSYYQAAAAFLEASRKALEEDIFLEAAGAGADDGVREPGGYDKTQEQNAYHTDQDRNAYGTAAKEEPVTASDILIRLLIAMLAGGAAVGLMLLGRKTGSRPGSAPYMASSPRVVRRSDRYTNTTVVKTRINTDNHSGSSGGGSGGSFHTSSGGHSYGGGGRSF